jgi:hypothetical protein
MKILICLAMSCGLTAILYFYLKHKLYVIETRLNTLTDLAQTLATELYNKEKQKESFLMNDVSKDESSDSDSSDSSDSDSSDSSDSESSDSESEEPEKYIVINELPVSNHILPVVFKEIKLEPETKQIPLLDAPVVESEPIVVNKQEEVDEKLIEVSDDESVKKVTVDNDYSQFSLKDLKQKVNDLGGPPLKTKQALINFLKKKV